MLDPLLPYLSIGLSMIPVIGDAADLLGAFAGYDPVTGQPLANWERSVMLLTLIPGVGGGMLLATMRHGDEIASAIAHSDDLTDGAKRVYHGGPHWKMQAKGIQSHHLPPDSVNGIPERGRGMALQMDPPDHFRTTSRGRGVGPDAYRGWLEGLLASGRVRDVMAIEILDIRRIAGSKYNNGLRELLEYARKIEYIPANPRRSAGPSVGS